MVGAERIVVWIPSGEPGWMLEAARPYEARAIGGGIRTLYELSAALAAAGRRVELRGVYVPALLDEVCAAAGARPELPETPRAADAGDTVIVPEGIDDPAIHARVVLSPARAVLLVLGPPGLIGWSFGSGWSRPDPLTVDPDAVARAESFRAAADLGYELWTHTPGIQRAAEAAGVPCRFIGNGVPGGYPSPAAERDIDVVWLRANRWAPLARPVVRELSERGVRCVGAGAGDQASVLDLFARARVLLHPLRVEGHSRVGCEARAMGAVPVVLAISSLSVGLDAGGGAVAVGSPGELTGAVMELLGSADRLAELSDTAMRTARAQVEWGPFVQRAEAALEDAPPTPPAREARAAIGAALRERGAATEAQLDALRAEVAELRPELDRHKAWLDATAGSLSWRATAPLRAAKRSLRPGGRSEEAMLALRGRIEWPPDGSERERAPVDVHGWCLFPGSTVARVEVRLNGGPAELARIAVERPATVPDVAHPDAPLCAFEHKVDLAEMAPDAAVVEVEALAHALDGRRLALDPVRYTLVPARDAPTDPYGELAELRRRAAPPARPRRRPTGLRLLAFSHMLGRNGGSLYLLELLRQLGRSPGVSCEVVAFADGPLREAFESEGIAVHLTDGHHLGDPVRYENHIAELLAWSALREFDAVLVNTLGAFPGADVAGALGLPAVWAVHESFPLPMYWFTAYAPGQLHPYVRSRAEAALRASAAVVFVADATRALFTGDADPERLVTLPYGVESPRSLDRAEARRKLGIGADARVMLCLGTVEPRKAQGLLAQAFAAVADRHPDALLALVGATDEAWCAGYRAALDDYLARSDLGDRVRVEPETGDPSSWHAAADLVVCASDIESLPRSLTEAMAFGTPVLSTRVFGVPELIEDGVNGFLCEARDVADMARALDRALAMPAADLAAVARAGRERVRARHDPEACAAQVLQLVEGLVRPQARPSGNGVPISSPP